MSAWIDMNDRVPAVGTACLVVSQEPWEKAPSIKLDRWAQIHEAPVSFSSATVYVGDGWEDDHTGVTHWQPVPALPSAEIPAPEGGQQRLPLAQATAPRKIWLQSSGVEFDMAEPFPDNHEGITWCEDEIGDGDVPYIRADLAAQPAPKLEDIEQYRLQMAGISTAALGYWKESDGILPDYDTLALRDVEKLYAKYDKLFKEKVEAQANPPQPAEPSPAEGDERAAFEREFPVHAGLVWDGSKYALRSDDWINSYQANGYLAMWRAWQARATLAHTQPKGPYLSPRLRAFADAHPSEMAAAQADLAQAPAPAHGGPYLRKLAARLLTQLADNRPRRALDLDATRQLLEVIAAPADADKLVADLTRNAWEWGVSCEIDDVRWGQDGDSHNQMWRDQTAAAASRLQAALLAAPSPAVAPLLARAKAEWHEDDGAALWWAWNGHGWAGEAAWIGTPLDDDWPGYHTHWTAHPAQPITQQGAKS